MHGDSRPALQSATPLQRTHAQYVRAVMARKILGAESGQLSVGDVRLYPHQTAAVQRIQAAIEEFGGALLSDEVGLGKTYVALAVAASIARGGSRVLIVAPATLGPMWHAACAHAKVEADLISMEALSYRPDVLSDAYSDMHLDTHSKQSMEKTQYPLVIVDEAHHARTPSTKRYAALAQLCTNARVLLLSATPIHNTQRDLTSLLALFLGVRADTLSQTELSRVLIRRTQSRTRPPSCLPTVRRTRWLRPATDERFLKAILALPPAIPARHAGEANTLVRHTLLRQWASSDGALRQALRRRRGQATALLTALDAGHYPSKQELQSWLYADDAIQLAFTELLAPKAANLTHLAHMVRAHTEAVNALLQMMTPSPTTAPTTAPTPAPTRSSTNDERRAAAILHLCHKHSREKIIAFSQYADTVETLFRILRPTGRVAALTSRGGLVAGGHISRQEAIARFAPNANGAAPPAPCDDITLLLTTDILSEGVNLQDASVILHLDLPWTAAKFDQRTGRVARLGSPYRHITVYAFRPPARLDAMLRLTDIVDAKSRIAREALGGRAFRSPNKPTRLPSVPELTETIRAHLSRWATELIAPQNTELQTTRQMQSAIPVCVGAVRSHITGFLALCLIDDTPTLVTTDAEGVPTTELAAIERSLQIAHHTDTAIGDRHVTRALHALHRWYETVHAATDAGIPQIAPHTTRAIRTQRTLLRRIAALNASTPLAHRPRLAPIAQAARHTIAQGRPGALTHALRLPQFTTPPHHAGDDAWLRHFAEPVFTPPTAAQTPRAFQVLALLLFA